MGIGFVGSVCWIGDVAFACIVHTQIGVVELRGIPKVPRSKKWPVAGVRDALQWSVVPSAKVRLGWTMGTGYIDKASSCQLPAG